MKLKVCKSAAKRVKVKKNFISRIHANKRHLLSNKTNSQLRRLSKSSKIDISDLKTFKRMICF